MCILQTYIKRHHSVGGFTTPNFHGSGNILCAPEQWVAVASSPWTVPVAGSPNNQSLVPAQAVSAATVLTRPSQVQHSPAKGSLSCAVPQNTMQCSSHPRGKCSCLQRATSELPHMRYTGAGFGKKQRLVVFQEGESKTRYQQVVLSQHMSIKQIDCVGQEPASVHRAAPTALPPEPETVQLYSRGCTRQANQFCLSAVLIYPTAVSGEGSTTSIAGGSTGKAAPHARVGSCTAQSVCGADVSAVIS